MNNNNQQRTGVVASVIGMIAGVALLFIADPSYAAIVPTSCAEGSCTICEFFEMIQNIINFLLSLAGSLALLGLVMGGVRYMTAGSNPQLIQKAKDTFKYTGVGFLLVVGGWLMIAMVLNVIGNKENEGSWYRFTCTTMEISSGGTEGVTTGRGADGGGSVGALKNAEFKSVSQWLPQINEVATKYGLDPCILVTIVRKESVGGNANTIGNDALFYKVEGAESFNKNEKGKGITQPAPLFGLKWDCPRCSWGFGLTQITIFPFESTNNTGTILGNGNGWIEPGKPSYYDITGKQWFYPNQLMDPKISLELGAKHFLRKMAESKTANRGLDDSFGRYNGGAKWEGNTNAKTYSAHAMQIYNLCTAERGTQTAGTVAPGSFKGKSCAPYSNLPPDTPCTVEANPLILVQSEYITTYSSGYNVYLRKNVADDLLRFAAAYKTQFGKPLMITNGWRSITFQQCAQENDTKGIVGAPAKLGEKMRGHQSGMAIDFSLDKPESACEKHKAITGSSGFVGAASGGVTTAEWKWMLQEGPKYGFHNLGTRPTVSYAKKYDKYRSNNTEDDMLTAMFCGPEAWHFDYWGPKYNETKSDSDKASSELVCASKQ